MVFSSLSFLIVFLPILLIVYFIACLKCKNIRQYVLLIFSLLFYGIGEPIYIFLIIICIYATWILSKYVDLHSKWALSFSIFLNIIPLIITKYAGFIVDNFSKLFRIESVSVPSIVMPIGISFYTFQVITYIVDLYNKKVKRQENPVLFALYIMFFPQLVAGPIVKYQEVEKELKNPEVNWDNVKYGFGRFISGLGKKVLIANQVGEIASSIQNNPLSSLTVVMTWLCVFAYTIQIYFDFSGYSDMAIGLGAIFGFHFPENFIHPYTAESISDFWRRWHITLGRFFREYVYIPLGGNRVNTIKWFRNIFIVWALTGLWHGASWNFVIWGVYYGGLIVFEKVTGIGKRIPDVLAWLFTFLLVSFGWGIFMCDGLSFKQTVKFLSKLLFISGNLSNPVTVSSLQLWRNIPFLIIGFAGSTPLWVNIIKIKVDKYRHKNDTLIKITNDIEKLLILTASLIFLIGGTYNPFIYFRF